MPRKRDPNRPKRPSIFAKGFCPYGTYEGPRWNTDRWRAAFEEAMSPEQAEQILGSNSPWDILGVKPGASPAEIKTAWRAAALKWHPDRHQGDDAKKIAAEKFKAAKAAYVKLSGA